MLNVVDVVNSYPCRVRAAPSPGARIFPKIVRLARNYGRWGAGWVRRAGGTSGKRTG